MTESKYPKIFDSITVAGRGHMISNRKIIIVLRRKFNIPKKVSLNMDKIGHHSEKTYRGCPLIGVSLEYRFYCRMKTR